MRENQGLRPRDVAGFAAASSAGAVPAVPDAPPAVRVHPTASAQLHRVAGRIAVMVVAVMAVALVGNDDGRLGWTVLAVLLAVLAVGLHATRAALRSFLCTLVTELHAGYTTTTFEMGRFWAGQRPPGPLLTNGHVGWSWSAVWVLRPDGTVKAAPSGDGDPPGLYPSPHRPGTLQLWTGLQWSGYHPTDEIVAAAMRSR